ncbi:unnamed protein product, partial [Brenthis ino]
MAVQSCNVAPNARQNKKTKKNNSQKRREQVKHAMRRHRQKLSEEQLEQRRKKDRERYNRKKEQGLISNINELIPRAQKIIIQQWKERPKKYRDKKKAMEQIRQQTEDFVENDTLPDSPTSSSSRSRAESGWKIGEKNKRRLKLENVLLREKLRIMEIRLKNKGSPDGIGATIKRTADQSVARGYDVANFQQLVQCLIKNCKGVQILPVDDDNVATIEHLLSRSLAQTFKGTFTIHQVAWNKNSPGLLNARKLSCTECHPHQICRHYEIGIINTEAIRDSFDEGEVFPSSSHSDHTLDTSDKKTYKKARASESSSPPCTESLIRFDNSHSVRRILQEPNPFLMASSSILKERKCSTLFDDSECNDS